jgi:hypothetical protein
MKTRIDIAVASDHLVIDVLRPVRSRGLGFLIQKGVATLKADTDAYYELVERNVLAGNTESDHLRQLLLQGLKALQQRHNLVGAHLRVDLGYKHAKVGVMACGPTQGQFSAAEWGASTQAWAVQMWNTNAHDCIIRHSPLADGRAFMVTCVDKGAVEAIHSVCTARSFAFVHCAPALLSQLQKVPSDTPNVTDGAFNIAVFVEKSFSGAPAPMVQLVALNNGQPQSVYRIWLNGAPDTDMNAGIKKAIRLVQLNHNHSGVLSGIELSWPDHTGVVIKDKA